MKFKYNDLVKIVGIPFYEGLCGHVKGYHQDWTEAFIFTVFLIDDPSSPLQLSAENLEKAPRVVPK